MSTANKVTEVLDLTTDTPSMARNFFLGFDIMEGIPKKHNRVIEWTGLKVHIPIEMHSRLKEVQEQEGYATLSETARTVIEWGLESLDE